MESSNAAFHLAAILRTYDASASQRPEAVRGFQSINDLDSWRRHSEVADLVKSVDYTLQGMDAAGVNVDMFVLALPRWYAAVNFATLPWGITTNGKGTRAACAPSDIALLEALGLVIKTGGGVELGEDDRRALIDVLAEARQLIEDNADDMPADVRHYVWSLIIRAEMVVQNLEKYGTATVRQVAFELGGVMTAQAERAEAHGEGERAGRWRSTAQMLMIGFMGGTGQGAAGQLGEAAQHIVKQLGG